MSSVIDLKPFFHQFSLTYGNIKKSKKVFNSMDFYLKLVNDAQNMPNGFQSDHCLSEIFNDCKISKMCKKIESFDDFSFGYSQTHKYKTIRHQNFLIIRFNLCFRLLFHLLNNIVCKQNDFPSFSRKICGKVFQETSFLMNNIEEVPEIRDLLMEQVFLCSLVGFGEFLNNNWITKILQWQMDSGCFSYDNVTCSNHMNGLGAANLALFGKKLLKNEKYSIDS
jgi:Domain of unknown function (DUF4735)